MNEMGLVKAKQGDSSSHICSAFDLYLQREILTYVQQGNLMMSNERKPWMKSKGGIVNRVIVELDVVRN
jgi:hypothetical protein